MSLFWNESRETKSGRIFKNTNLILLLECWWTRLDSVVIRVTPLRADHKFWRIHFESKDETSKAETLKAETSKAETSKAEMSKA